MEEEKNVDEEELQEVLSKTTCRGCYNHCILTAPCCGRSGVFIKEVIERLKNS